MSLETAIQENTKALQYLAEIVKQAMSMKPVQAPATAAPVEPVAAADLPPVAATKAARNFVRPWSPNCKSSSSIHRLRAPRFSDLSA